MRFRTFEIVLQQFFFQWWRSSYDNLALDNKLSKKELFNYKKGVSRQDMHVTQKVSNIEYVRIKRYAVNN